ncbi:unnamed protein product [Moneuplotes crassus]|uniref:Uncharacterized protein n=1 Tax=Euplotes crassus TaxID=5936 RepID=A0AAD1Y655_EUPCR|nr:unnamed protein product [Moneuplotes crassus]
MMSRTCPGAIGKATQQTFGYQKQYEGDLDSGLAMANSILRENVNHGNQPSQNYLNRAKSPMIQIEDKENFNNYINNDIYSLQNENYPEENNAVEDRLSIMDKVYKQRRQERAIDNTSKNKKLIQAPKISKNSKKILQQKYGNFPQKRVDQRLYDDHQKRQMAQNMREKQSNMQNQDLINPMASPSSMASYHSVQAIGEGDGNEIANRLMDYKLKYKDHEKNLQKKYDDKECTFKPKINTRSAQYASQPSYAVSLEFRNSMDVKKYQNRENKIKSDQNCTFKPEVSRKSKELAEKKEYFENQPSNVFNRLGGYAKNSDVKSFENSSCGYNTENNFKPTVNPISEEIDINIHHNDERPRWERLYQLKDERDYMLSQKMKLREFEKFKEEQQCTFKPKLLSKSVERKTNTSTCNEYYRNLNFSPDLNVLDRITNRDYNVRSPMRFSFSDQERFDEVPSQEMDVHQRAQLWTKAKEKKLEKIRNKSKGKGMEECTFKPNLKKGKRSRSNLRGSKSMKRFQTANSIQKYVNRISGVRETRDTKEIREGKKVGSGKNWTHRITVPREPALSYKNGRKKVKRKNASIERNISKELLSRNVSLKDIDTKNYNRDYDNSYSMHNHYYQEDESETMLRESIHFENLQRSRELAEQKLRSHNESGFSYASSYKSGEQSIFNQNSFSRSQSKIEQLKKKVISQVSPSEKNVRQRESMDAVPRMAKPPLAPTGSMALNKSRESTQKMLRISDQEILEDENEELGSDGEQDVYQNDEPPHTQDNNFDSESVDIDEDIFDDLKGVFHTVIQNI